MFDIFDSFWGRGVVFIFIILIMALSDFLFF